MIRRAHHATRLILRLAACALIGAVLTVGIAWAASSPQGHNWDHSGWYQEGDRIGRLFRMVGPFYTEECVGKSVDSVGLSRPPGTLPLPVLKRSPWARLPGGQDDCARTWAFGWPEPALVSVMFEQGSGIARVYRIVGGLRVEWLGRVLPIYVFWPGFALDTTFYAAIALTLWSAPPAIRRRTHRARGRCPACGYDLRGAPTATCPECGT